MLDVGCPLPLDRWESKCQVDLKNMKMGEKVSISKAVSSCSSCNNSFHRGTHLKSGSIDVEIQVNQCNRTVCLLIVLMVLWLPAAILLFHSHVTVRVEMSQKSAELALLRAEVESLSRHTVYLVKLLSQSSPDGSAPHGSTYHQDLKHKRGNIDSQQPLRNFRGPSEDSSQVGRQKRGVGPDSVLDMKHSFSPMMLQEPSIRRGDGVQVIHLKGAHPERLVEAGNIGPWFIDSKAVNDRASSSFLLRERGDSVEVKDQGLYLIYAQVYYLTSSVHNSFSVNLLSKNSENPVVIAMCSTNALASTGSSEVSCFTATVRLLHPGDRINVQQRERNRRLIMRGGYSFLGLVKMGADTNESNLPNA